MISPFAFACVSNARTYGVMYPDATISSKFVNTCTFCRKRLKSRFPTVEKLPLFSLLCSSKR